MHFGTVQICGERLRSIEVRQFCDALEANKLKMLSLRECGMSLKNFKKLMISLGYCKSILHVNFNLCGIDTSERAELLASALNTNRSLEAVLLHGNEMSTDGVCKVIKALIQHPTVTCLDVGDCDIGDKGLKYICELLPGDGSKQGLQELVLSANPRISCRAWEKFAIALAAGSHLRALYLDYNNLGDTAGKMIAVAASGHKSLQVVDLEACDLTEEVGRLFMYLVQHFPTQLSHILLEENFISSQTKYAIRVALGESESEDSSGESECEEVAIKKTAKKKKTVKAPAKLDSFASNEAELLMTSTTERTRKKMSRLQVPAPGTRTARPPQKRAPRPAVVTRSASEVSNSVLISQSASASNTEDEQASEEQDVALSLPQDYDVTYTFKPQPNSQSDGRCHVDQNIVECADGRRYLKITGECEETEVSVRVRSRSRSPNCRSPVPRPQTRRNTSRSRSRCRQARSSGRTHVPVIGLCSAIPTPKPKRHRSASENVKLIDKEQFSESDEDLLKSKRDRGRGPWCGGSKGHRRDNDAEECPKNDKKTKAADAEPAKDKEKKPQKGDTDKDITQMDDLPKDKEDPLEKKKSNLKVRTSPDAAQGPPQPEVKASESGGGHRKKGSTKATQ